jgi:hypothetical protein
MARSPNNSESGKRVRKSTKQQVLEVLALFKSDLEIDRQAFDGDFNKYDDCPPITKIFEAADMDRAKVANWQSLLLACATCLFPEDEEFSPKGRPRVWTDDVEDRLIEWWFTARREFGRLGERALFEAMIEKHGPFQIGPNHVMSDPESLRVRFQMIKVAAKVAVQNNTARERQRQLIEALSNGTEALT